MSIIERWRRNIRIEANYILAQQAKEIIARFAAYSMHAYSPLNFRRCQGSICHNGKLLFHYKIDDEGKITTWR